MARDRVVVLESIPTTIPTGVPPHPDALDQGTALFRANRRAPL